MKPFGTPFPSLSPSPPLPLPFPKTLSASSPFRKRNDDVFDRDSSKRNESGDGGRVLVFWSAACLRLVGVHRDPRHAEILGWSPSLGERVAKRLGRTA